MEFGHSALKCKYVEKCRSRSSLSCQGAAEHLQTVGAFRACPAEQRSEQAVVNTREKRSGCPWIRASCSNFCPATAVSCSRGKKCAMDTPLGCCTSEVHSNSFAWQEALVFSRLMPDLWFKLHLVRVPAVRIGLCTHNLVFSQLRVSQGNSSIIEKLMNTTDAPA